MRIRFLLDENLSPDLKISLLRSSSTIWEHLTYAMSINAYVRQKLEHLQLDHKEK
jgi:hypothetical protein